MLLRLHTALRDKTAALGAPVLMLMVSSSNTGFDWHCRPRVFAAQLCGFGVLSRRAELLQPIGDGAVHVTLVAVNGIADEDKLAMVPLKYVRVGIEVRLLPFADDGVETVDSPHALAGWDLVEQAGDVLHYALG